MRPYLSEELVRLHAERLRDDFVGQRRRGHPRPEGRRGRHRGGLLAERASVPVITLAKVASRLVSKSRGRPAKPGAI